MKKLKRILSFGMAAVIALSMSISASAESDCDSSMLLSETVLSARSDDEGYVLIFEETYVNEDGVTVTHRSYIKDAGISPQGSISKGEADIKEEYKFSPDRIPWVTLSVEGHFKWDSAENRATVTLLNHGYTIHNDTAKVVSEPPVRIGDDQGGFWGGKRYAFIEKTITMDNGIQVGLKDGKQTFRLWVDVNADGEKNREHN